MPRVLVVDDDFDFREALGRFLLLAGHEAAFASNGWEALIELDRAEVDLIILDLMMPGMDGTTFLKILRGAARGKALPVIIVTALNEEDAKPRLKDVAVQGMLRKNPQLIDDLMDQIERLFGPDPKLAAR